VNFLIIQEAGRHQANAHFRESLCLKTSLNKIEGNKAEVWGLNYPRFEEFDELEKWADVIFILENYTPSWLPLDKIIKSKKIKIFWSIDSHCVLHMHIDLHKTLKPDIHLNSTESYLPYFIDYSKLCYWFPNAYPCDLIKPLPVEKNVNVGFCGSFFPEREALVNDLKEFNAQYDVFVIGEKMVETICSYKIHLNKNLSNDINYRTFETLGCKTFLLTNHTPGLEKLFDIGKDLVTYSDLNDLKQKVKYYLNNEKERKIIEEHGHATALKRHTYDARCRYLMRIISGTL